MSEELPNYHCQPDKPSPDIKPSELAQAAGSARLPMDSAPRCGKKVLLEWDRGMLAVCEFSKARQAWIVSINHMLAPMAPIGWLELPNTEASQPRTQNDHE